MVDTIIADVLATQGAMASTAMMLTYLFEDIQISVPEMLTHPTLGDLKEILDK